MTDRPFLRMPLKNHTHTQQKQAMEVSESLRNHDISESEITNQGRVPQLDSTPQRGRVRGVL